jgi:hypothetical protein
MTALPSIAEFTGAITQGEFKTAQTNLISFLEGLLGTDGTISSMRTALGTIGHTMVDATSALTITNADRGTGFLCTGTWTLSLSSWSTFSQGCTFMVLNIGTGTITIDPATSELINGQTTLDLPANTTCFITVTQYGFFTIPHI